MRPVTLSEEEKTERQRGESHLKTEAQIGVMLPQAKEPLEPPEAGRGRKDTSHRFQRERDPASILISDFWPPEL